MKEDQEEHHHHHQDEEDQVRHETTTKRKLEDNILLAKQKAQEIASRLVSHAESKRPRLGNDDSPEPAPYSNSASNPPFPVSFVAQTGQYQGSQATSKKISIPNGKVGLIIGKGGETIKYLQIQAGAKIQITKDVEADPYSLTRAVELTGTSEQISRAEQLINDVIAQTEAGGSAPSAKQDAHPVQPGAEQFVMKIPNNKVALLIGKGGETIRNMQSRSGARMQIVPLHLPPGDTSTERTVYIDGLKEQIESAKELINEVLSGKRLVNPSSANSSMQPAYTGAGNWGVPGQHPMQQQPHYGYTQPGSYGQHPPATSYYSNYPTLVAAWDPSHQATNFQQPQQSTGYGYYGQQTQVGLTTSNPSYSYNQTLPTSHGYDQSYSQQPSNYGQPISSEVPVPNDPNPYVSSEYGVPPPSSNQDGTSSSQTTQPLSAYSYAHSQATSNSQAGYWAYPSNTSQPPAQPFYDQTGYYQTMYGGQQAQVPSAALHSGYGEDGYPQSTSAPANYDQTTNPGQGGKQLEQQPQQQLETNGSAHSSVNGAQRAAGGNSNGDGSASSVPETADAQS